MFNYLPFVPVSPPLFKGRCPAFSGTEGLGLLFVVSVKRLLLLAVIVSFFFSPHNVAAYELKGQLGAEGSYFIKEPLYSAQKRNAFSLGGQAEFYNEFPAGFSLTLTPFYRWDSADDERTHFDIREALLLWPTERFELRAGVTKVFWGVTESRHLVDIINQTDLVESLDEEEKLGQPMVNLTLPSRFGSMDFFVLPYFRERTFPGEKGRLRIDPVVDMGSAVYESSEKERHVDFAARYGGTFGDMDIGISHFYGTSREPALNPKIISPTKIVLSPYYELIHQTGLAVQLVHDAWLLKLEAVYRSGGDAGSFSAAVAGFEYAVPGLDIGGAEISLLAEYLYDDREPESTYDNDYFLAVRAALNDVAGSELLAGYFKDAVKSSASMVVEASRRMGDSFRAELEAYLFIDPDKKDILYYLRNDDFARFTLTYYF